MKILLAIDDSKYSTAAIRAIRAQYPPAQAAVRVLHVVEPLEIPYYPDLAPPYPASLVDVEKGRIKAGRNVGVRAADQLRKAGFRVTVAVREGSVRPAIVDDARKWHADLIVVGSHGRTGVKRMLLGSVSEYVARHAHCSVEIVRMKAGR